MLQGGRCLLRGILLQGADDGVDQQHRGDEARIRPLLDQQRDQRSGAEHIDQRAEKLMQKHQRHPGRFGPGQGVAPVALQAGCGFLLAEAMDRPIQLGQGGIPGQMMKSRSKT